jgi:hypothetical protein
MNLTDRPPKEANEERCPIRCGIHTPFRFVVNRLGAEEAAKSQESTSSKELRIGE